MPVTADRDLAVRGLLVTWLPARVSRSAWPLRSRRPELSGVDKKPPPYAVFAGLDVGKGEHHACALDADGTRLHDMGAVERRGRAARRPGRPRPTRQGPVGRRSARLDRRARD